MKTEALNIGFLKTCNKSNVYFICSFDDGVGLKQFLPLYGLHLIVYEKVIRSLTFRYGYRNDR